MNRHITRAVGGLLLWMSYTLYRLWVRFLVIIPVAIMDTRSPGELATERGTEAQKACGSRQDSIKPKRSWVRIPVPTKLSNQKVFVKYYLQTVTAIGSLFTHAFKYFMPRPEASRQPVTSRHLTQLHLRHLSHYLCVANRIQCEIESPI